MDTLLKPQQPVCMHILSWYTTILSRDRTLYTLHSLKTNWTHAYSNTTNRVGAFTLSGTPDIPLCTKTPWPPLADHSTSQIARAAQNSVSHLLKSLMSLLRAGVDILACSLSLILCLVQFFCCYFLARNGRPSLFTL